MSNASNLEVITSVKRRRRWAVEEKISWVRRSMEPGMTISIAVREAGVAPSQLFTWKRLYLEGGLSAVGANESVVAASELQEAQRRIKQLEQALGRKTLENDILREAVDFAKSKKWPLQDGAGSKERPLEDNRDARVGDPQLGALV
jgi:transposase